MAGICGSCTKCCEAIHVAKDVGARIIAGDPTLMDAPFLQKIWEPITKEQAKEINPYMFSDLPSKPTQHFVSNASFFRCRKVVVGEGCSIHDARPQVCRNYMGDDSYVENCIPARQIN